ncbi:MAG TPA: GNAT family N-acetyltransferase [Cyanobacteria bacterium UBA11049]|nr:GNAT family N-acetyltransferase [Cyanobacteria bacterium UBA11049]
MQLIYETNRIRVRLFTPDDVSDAYEFMSDPEVARYEYWSPYTQKQAEKEIVRLSKVYPGTIGKWNEFAVELKETGKVIGCVCINLEDNESWQAEIGFHFNRHYQGKGLAYEASMGLFAYGIELSVHRFYATVDVRNQKSVALMERLGMRREGHFRENCYVKGEWCDEYLYAILAREIIARTDAT